MGTDQEHAENRSNKARQVESPLATDDICDNAERKSPNPTPLASDIDGASISSFKITHARPAFEHEKINPCLLGGTFIS